MTPATTKLSAMTLFPANDTSKSINQVDSLRQHKVTQTICRNPILNTTSALPGNKVVISNVPTSLGEVNATVIAPDASSRGRAIARPLNGNSVSVITPLYPSGSVAGGKVNLIISIGTIACSKLELLIKPLPAAPGTIQAVVKKLESLTTQLTQTFNVDPQMLLGDTTNLPVEALPLYLAQGLLDNPKNPNSLKAILNGTAPVLEGKKIDLDLLDRVLAVSGVPEALNKLTTALLELEPISRTTPVNKLTPVAYKDLNKKVFASQALLDSDPEKLIAGLKDQAKAAAITSTQGNALRLAISTGLAITGLIPGAQSVTIPLSALNAALGILTDGLTNLLPSELKSLEFSYSDPITNAPKVSTDPNPLIFNEFSLITGVISQ